MQSRLTLDYVPSSLVGALTGFGGAVTETGSESVTWSSRSHCFAVFSIFESL